MAEAPTNKVEAPELGDSSETESVQVNSVNVEGTDAAINVEAFKLDESLETGCAQVNSVELTNEENVDSTNNAIKVEAFKSAETLETGCVQVNSVQLRNEENTKTTMSEEHKEQDLHEVVLNEKVLTEEAGKQHDSEGNSEESREKENGTKTEDLMVVDEGDVQKMAEFSEPQGENESSEDNDIENRNQDKEARSERKEHPILATITVSIGPLRLEDLDSDQMRDILNYSKGYTLTFEKKEEGLLSKEKERARHEGYAEIPYLFYNDAYLMKTYNKLRNLRIDNRDLSVTFPEEFVKIAEECSARIRLKQEGRRKIQDVRRTKVEIKMRSLFAKNIPPDIEEETLKAEFPGCTKVVIPKNSEGISVGFAVLEFESAEESTKCFETHDQKDIQNHKISLSRIAFEGDGFPRRVRQQKGNRGKNRQQRGIKRWGKGKKHRDDRSRSGERRSPRNDHSRRRSRSYKRDAPMPPPLMGNISTWSRYNRGGGESGYNRHDNRGNKRSRSPNRRNQKRFREDSYGRMENSRQRGDASGWGGYANTGRSRSPEDESEATLAYLRQQLVEMEEIMAHSQGVPVAGPVSSSGRNYGSGGHKVLLPAGPVSTSGRSYGSGGFAAIPPAGPVSGSDRSYGNGYGNGYGSGGFSGAVSDYSSGTEATGYGSSARPVIGYPTSGYTSGGYNYGGYGSGNHASGDSLLGTHPTYPSGDQPHSGGGSSRIEDAYNSFSKSKLIFIVVISGN
ncbi:hypothetical protein ACJMK2_035337 [Sinanodonta woodiana]|uniref:RRM domain-containing protein n=1 Tax=Sinanodonta woodiana TaxID=1069815 RepID=A0ABD3WVX1_SINWO